MRALQSVRLPSSPFLYIGVSVEPHLWHYLHVIRIALWLQQAESVLEFYAGAVTKKERITDTSRGIPMVKGARQRYIVIRLLMKNLSTIEYGSKFNVIA
jgi:hypothetical protein